MSTLTRTTSPHPNQIRKLLSEKGKNISVKFEILTKKKFFEAISESCGILQIDLMHEEEDCFIFEDELLPVACKCSFKEIKDYFLQQNNHFGHIDILIIGAKNVFF
jgi:hypothetical protein